MGSSKALVHKALLPPTSSGFEDWRTGESNRPREGSLALVPHGGSSPPALSDELLAAWRANPRCTECGALVDGPHEAALLVVANRITHATACFLPALLRGHPTLTRLSARAPSREVMTGQEKRKDNA